MAKAYKPPPWVYTRRLHISEHAIERFRERAEKEHQARSDDDLGNLLDERIRFAEKSETFFDTREPDDVTAAVQVTRHDGTHFYAVIRENVVVTVLDEEMFDMNFAKGLWTRERPERPEPVAAPAVVSKTGPQPLVGRSSTLAEAAMNLASSKVEAAKADRDLQIAQRLVVARTEALARAKERVIAAETELEDAVKRAVTP